MFYRTAAAVLTVGYLMALPGGCAQRSTTSTNMFPGDIHINSSYGEIDEGFHNNHIITPGDSYEEPELPDDTQPDSSFTTLPNGYSVPTDCIETWDDGTMIAKREFEHFCFFPDGTYAEVMHYNADYESCLYQDSTRVFAEYFLENGNILKKEEYQHSASGELFLLSRTEYEYTPLEIGNEDAADAVYLSSSTCTYYDETLEEYCSYYTLYDPVHGPDRPISTQYSDGSRTEDEYNLDGTMKQSSYYDENGDLSFRAVYENGMLKTEYSFYNGGRGVYESHYKNGEVYYQRHHNQDYGCTYETYFENGQPYIQYDTYTSGALTTHYYDDHGNETHAIYNDQDGNYDGKVIFQYNDDGSYKCATYYNRYDEITEVDWY